MPVELRMPMLGMTMEEGKVVAWRVREGERVTGGQIVVEIEAEKAAYELEAPVDGTIGLILVAADDTVPVGTPLVSILAVDEPAPAPSPPGREPVRPRAETRPEPTVTQGAAGAPPARRRLSPRARALADSLGVDVESIVGTGPEGTVVEKDIRDAAARAARPPSREAPPGEVPSTLSDLSVMRRMIAARMAQSAREVPHFFLAVEVDGSALLAWRDAHAGRLEAESGVALTITDLLVAATGRTLGAHPSLNASWSSEGIRRWNEVNLGLAVAVEDGLIVPVLRRADRKPIALLMRERHDLVERARTLRLRPGDLQGGTFTLSNLGGLGIDVFTSILNPPEAGILSVGALRERPVVVEGRVVARPTAYIGLTIDHRVTDGAAGARFLRDWKTRVENGHLED
jgi:pyruvate dehydrogenase E2 component (dihydrolipoyllysine-residue acetyltransferase)